MSEPIGEPQAVDPNDPVLALWLPISAIRTIMHCLQRGVFIEVLATVNLISEQVSAQLPPAATTAPAKATDTTAPPTERLN
jgi:hypothetical protein